MKRFFVSVCAAALLFAACENVNGPEPPVNLESAAQQEQAGKSVGNTQDGETAGNAQSGETSGTEQGSNTAGGAQSGEADESVADTRTAGLYSGSETAPVEGVAGLVPALAWLGTNAVDGGVYTIILDTDETVGKQDLFYQGRELSLTVKGYAGGPAPNIGLSGSGSIFSVKGTKTGFSSGKSFNLVLENITLTGSSTNNAALVSVGEYAFLELKTGSEITGNTHRQSGTGSQDVKGGGVYVFTEGAPGGLTLNGGKITKNTVYANSTGTGAAFAAYPIAHGGGVYIQDGSFVMNSGEISGNTAQGDSRANTAAAYGGGVYALGSAEVTILGGSITGNTAEASGEEDPAPPDAKGGGLYVTLMGFDNHINMGFTVSAEISGNTAKSTGRAQGGGIFVAEQSTLFLTGGVVSGNTAQSLAVPNLAYGGGVFALNNAKISKTGGVIYGEGSNQAVDAAGVPQKGHGHAVFSSSSGIDDTISGSYATSGASAKLGNGEVQPAGLLGSISLTLPEGAMPDRDTVWFQNYKSDPNAPNWDLRRNGVFLVIKVDGNRYDMYQNRPYPVPAAYDSATDTWKYNTGVWPESVKEGATISFEVVAYENCIKAYAGTEPTYKFIPDTTFVMGPDFINLKEVNFTGTAVRP